ncbi:MAG: flagellar hook-associated protein FlgK [Phycisphaerales bacterium]|nr:MAG: flagellar hook-associated protein FlgK [Phycisphaerales bacterium]
MGMISAALEIGRSAVMSYQGAMQAVGVNVANAGNPDYTRQTAGLSALPGIPIGHGLRPGAGVALSSLKRNLDEALEARIRAAVGERESAMAESDWVHRIETFFDELTGAGISTLLTDFFNALSEVQNSPEDVALRSVAIAAGSNLAGSIGRLRAELLAMGEELNEQIDLLVDTADGLAAEIADLNARIVAAEASGRAQANSLRDQRDARLRDLSEMFDVTVRTQPDGSIYVYIGSEALVQGGVSRGLKTEQVVDGEFVRSVVYFADTNAQVVVRGGRLEGLLNARDNQAYGRIASVDQFAAGLISEVNRVHSDGQGLIGFTSVTGTFDVMDVSAALNSPEAGLQNPPQHGSFFITVADDATATPVSYQINIDLDGIGTDTSLETLVDDINATVVGVTASITPDNRLQLVADTGYTFTFGHDSDSFREDTANVLAALGVNTFFDGSTAADICVNAALEADPRLLAASLTGLTGDGDNAGRITGTLNTPSDLLNGSSILEFYNNMATEVAVAGSAAHTGLESAAAVLSALQTQKENISGVSLDEEAIELVKYERAFQGAARYLGVVENMMSEMMNIIR